MATKDNAIAAAYNDCAAKHAGLVNAYRTARETAIRWNREHAE